MDSATSGSVVVDGRDLAGATEGDLELYRRTDVGFVFQFYNLIPNLTALENVELATQICSDSLDPAETLEKVGLAARLNNFPARSFPAVSSSASPSRAPWPRTPSSCCATSPRAPSTTRRASSILQLLQDMCRVEGITVVIVTHNAALADMADRLIRFKSGQVTSMTMNPNPTPIAEIEW